MTDEIKQHEKIRFGRADIGDLDGYPSAVGKARPRAPRRLARRRRRRSLRLVRAVFAAGLVLVALLVTVHILGAFGVGGARLQREAQAAIASVTGANIAARIGQTRFSLDPSRLIALEMRDAGLSDGDTGISFLDAGLVQFGVRFLPLLSGEVRLGSARLVDARINAGSLPDRGGPGPLAGLRSADGLLDPDLVTPMVFGFVQRIFDIIEANGARDIALQNVEIVLNEAAGWSVLVTEASLNQGKDGSLAMEGEGSIKGRAFVFETTATRDAATQLVTGLDMRLDFGSITDTTGDLSDIFLARELGSVEVRFHGAQASAPAADTLHLEARFGEALVGFGKSGPLPLDGELVATLAAGANKVEIDRLRLTNGETVLDFNGAFGPSPSSLEDGELSYRFELVSDNSTIAPSDSPAPPMAALARVAGVYEPAVRRLDLSEIGLRTQEGEVSGKGSVQFETGTVPGVDLALAVEGMPVAHAKQVWPWFAAPGARNWALQNVSGGEIGRGSIRLKAAPGRLGDGVPLNGSEISGRFALAGAKVNIAGDLPPLSDGVGTLAFSGHQVDIALQSGHVVLPGGKRVDGKNGTLGVAVRRGEPLIGDLSIDVAGETDAMVELAMLEPIDAGRFLEFDPQDFSGQATGTIKADVPLQPGIAMADLSFHVGLDYTDLAIAKPFQGQMVTAAKGKLVVEPTHAAIDAEARLNDVPASVHLIEPFGDSTIKRERQVSLTLNEGARAALVPGLSAMLSGDAAVDIDLSDAAGQVFSADLTAATLSLPWIGWSKGEGIPGKSFRMERDGETTRLEDFSLSGETFSAAGTIILDGGGLAEARLSRVRLNRDDKAAVDVVRKGKGYSVTVRGEALDVRPVIKLFTASRSGGGGGKGGEAVPISVDLDVNSVAGFHGEVLRDVSMSYSGSGSSIGSARFSAITASGTPVNVTDGSQGGARQVSMQSMDAGAVLRFLDVYERMEGGEISLALQSGGGGSLVGKVDARNFWLVNEPRLSSLVSSPSDSRGRSLNQVVQRDIDVSRVFFDRGFSMINKGLGYLTLDRGILRGPDIGASFQGTVFDQAGNMSMTGTFMPAYGINRLFGEIPLIGALLGNGRDRGLIGITFKLAGKVSGPQLQINPLSAIAPGIFRSVFEFR